MSPERAQKEQGRIMNAMSPTLVGEALSRFTTSDAARFWSKVNKTPTCWLWTAGVFGSLGYGQFRIAAEKRSQYAHRIAWELTRGHIPSGQHILHTCDVPRCVNPDHLFLGTQLENNQDAARKGHLHVQRPRRQTFSAENVAKIGPLRDAGMTLQGIAGIIGSSKAFVSLVLRGKRRQHPQPRQRSA